MPLNRRWSKDHDDWRRCMRAVWRLHPTLTFMTTKGDAMIVFGGFVHDNPQAVNDNSVGTKAMK